MRRTRLAEQRQQQVGEYARMPDPRSARESDYSRRVRLAMGGCGADAWVEGLEGRTAALEVACSAVRWCSAADARAGGRVAVVGSTVAARWSTGRRQQTAGSEGGAGGALGAAGRGQEGAGYAGHCRRGRGSWAAGVEGAACSVHCVHWRVRGCCEANAGQRYALRMVDRVESPLRV